MEDALHAFSPEAMQLVRSIMFALPDFNAELLEQPREVSYQEYFMRFQCKYAQDQDLSFMDFFKNIAHTDFVKQFVVPFEMLVKLGVVSTKTNKVKTVIETHHLVEGVDYISIETEVVDSSTGQKGVRYLLRPGAFKRLLMRIRKYKGQAKDPSVYCDYFILVEQVHHMYLDYASRFRLRDLEAKEEAIQRLTHVTKCLRSRFAEESTQSKLTERRLEDKIDKLQNDIKEVGERKEMLKARLAEVEAKYQDIAKEHAVLATAVETVNDYAVRTARISACKLDDAAHLWFAIVSRTDEAGYCRVELQSCFLDDMKRWIAAEKAKNDGLVVDLEPTFFACSWSLLRRGADKLESLLKSVVDESNRRRQAAIVKLCEEISSLETLQSEGAKPTLDKCRLELAQLVCAKKIEQSDLIDKETESSFSIKPNAYFNKDHVVAIYNALIDEAQCSQYRPQPDKKRKRSLFDPAAPLADGNNVVLERLNVENKASHEAFRSGAIICQEDH